MLIPLDDQIINADRIVSVTDASLSKAGSPQVRIETLDRGVFIARGSLEWFERFTGVTVPAPAGFSVIDALPPDSQSDEWHFPTLDVIAFRLNGGAPMPITAYGEAGERAYLRTPNGFRQLRRDEGGAREATAAVSRTAHPQKGPGSFVPGTLQPLRHTGTLGATLPQR